MAVTAKEVNKLRQYTSAGMMDCKKALNEAQGDFDKAVDLLRKKGKKIATARGNKEATQGAVFITTNTKNNLGAMIKLSSETDFVAKNNTFQHLGKAIAKMALENTPTSLTALKKLTIKNQSIQEKITEASGKLGEKIELSAYETLKTDVVVAYIHAGTKIGVLVGLKGKNSPETCNAGKEVAMQIAAMNPMALHKEEIDEATIQREREIAYEQAYKQGKPAAMLDQIVHGKLNKFFQENTLLLQTFIKDNKMSVGNYLQHAAPNITVNAFKRLSIG